MKPQTSRPSPPPTTSPARLIARAYAAAKVQAAIDVLTDDAVLMALAPAERDGVMLALQALALIAHEISEG